MPQFHYTQFGIFHITTKTKGRVPWCTWPGIPELLIDNLVMTRNIYKAGLYAFCILPDHMHLILGPGQRGLAGFMHSFKKNSSRDISNVLGRGGFRIAAPVNNQPPERSSGSKTAAAKAVEYSGWQKGYHDEHIRTGKQSHEAMAYVQYNAARHKLVDDIQKWPWTSLHFPQLIDPMEFWPDWNG